MPKPSKSAPPPSKAPAPTSQPSASRGATFQPIETLSGRTGARGAAPNERSPIDTAATQASLATSTPVSQTADAATSESAVATSTTAPDQTLARAISASRNSGNVPPNQLFGGGAQEDSDTLDSSLSVASSTPSAPTPEHSWTPSRTATLLRMWERGFDADEISKELGNVDAAAVVIEAQRIGLRMEPEQLGFGEGRPLHAALLRDPLAAVAGASVRANELIAIQWAERSYYLNNELRRTLNRAVGRANPEAPQAPPLVTATDLLAALLDDRNRKDGSRWLRRFPDFLDRSLMRFPSPREREEKDRAPPEFDAILRWDVVDILAMASEIRWSFAEEQGELEVPFVLAAFVFSPPGQVAITESMGIDQFDRFRAFAGAIFNHYVAEHDPAGARGVAAKRISEQLFSHPVVRAPTAPRAGYASDRVDPATTDPGITRDARALVDLILLEAAAPPLAIGVFGSWGSGKSTLLAALRREITQQTREEQDFIKAGKNDDDPETRRVAGVLQVELNAWSFADSENLWASLTSDIFEQIAAGGKDGARAAEGAKLVAEVAERGHKEAMLFRDAQAQRQEGEALRDAAEKAEAEALRDMGLGPVDAAVEVLLDYFAAPKGSDAGDNAKDGKTKDVVAAADKAESDSEEPKADSLTLFRDAVLLRDDTPPEERIRKYLSEGGAISRLFKMGYDYVRARGLIRTLGWTAAAAAAGFALYSTADYVLPTVREWAVAILPTVLGLAGVLGAIGYYAFPAIRAAALFKKKFDEKQRTANRRRMTAMTDRSAAQSMIDKAAVAERRNISYLQKYGSVREGGAPPALMLGYLLEDSAEIESLRGSLGTLGTVRKAFERLDMLVAKNCEGRTNEVQRIIITIDDLDRCSERQVVQILEAIHLLLAFPCFVVVAAVDARWLETALAEAHSQLKLADTKEGITKNATVTTPADYLEKIFQIAYWVRPLRANAQEFDGGSYGRMINELTGLLDDDVPFEVLPDRPDEPITVDNIVPLQLEPIEPWAPDALMVAKRESVRIAGEERELFHRLGPLAARSPRAVKRMINVYRLLRIHTRSADDVLNLLGPEGEAAPAPLVQFALACEAGLPASLFAEVVDRIETMQEWEWDQWRSSMDHGTFDASKLREVLADDDRYIVLMRALQAAEAAMTRVINIAELRTAFALAGRYSFRKPAPAPVDAGG